MQPTRRLCLCASLAVATLLCAGQRTFAETLTITSSPPGATVEIDGIAAGETPYRVEYPGGYFHKTHTVFSTRLEHAIILRVSKEGYLPQQMTITSGPYEWIGLTGKRHGTYFLLKSARFDVRLEAIHEAETDALAPGARAGPLRVRSEGRDSSVSGASASMARVKIASEPSGADIYVDGKFVGQTPSTIHLVTGEHRIEVKCDGRAIWQRDLEVLKESDLTLHAVLEAKQH